MKLHWRIFTNCKSEESARKVASKLFDQIEISASPISPTPYHKGGFLVCVHTEHPAQSWAEFVLQALVVAQSAGHGWELTGSITEELDASSNSSVISGITFIHIQALK